MTQPSSQKKPPAEDSAGESLRQSSTRRIDESDPVTVPRPPRLPTLPYPTRIDQDHIETLPENDLPRTDAPTMIAPPVRSPADIQLPDDDDERDTIPSPAPE